MASQQSVSKVNTTQLLAVAAVHIFILKPCLDSTKHAWENNEEENSLRSGGLYQNKGGENKNWHTLVSEGSSAGRQVSMFSFEDKGPAVEKRKKQR